MKTTFNGWPFHPAAKEMPLMTECELRDLAADIKRHGQKKPVELYEGKVLDGRNRILAILNFLPDTEPDWIELSTCDLGDSGDPYDYVISLGVKRRQLSPSQEAMIRSGMKEHYQKRAKKREREGQQRGRGTRYREKGVKAGVPAAAGTPAESAEWTEEAALNSGTNAAAIERCDRIRRAGCQPLIDAVLNKSVKIGTAARWISQMKPAAIEKVLDGTMAAPKASSNHDPKKKLPPKDKNAKTLSQRAAAVGRDIKSGMSKSAALDRYGLGAATRTRIDAVASAGNHELKEAMDSQLLPVMAAYRLIAATPAEISKAIDAAKGQQARKKRKQKLSKNKLSKNEWLSAVLQQTLLDFNVLVVGDHVPPKSTDDGQETVELAIRVKKVVVEKLDCLVKELKTCLSKMTGRNHS